MVKRAATLSHVLSKLHAHGGQAWVVADLLGQVETKYQGLPR